MMAGCTQAYPEGIVQMWSSGHLKKSKLGLEDVLHTGTSPSVLGRAGSGWGFVCRPGKTETIFGDISRYPGEGG